MSLIQNNIISFNQGIALFYEAKNKNSVMGKQIITLIDKYKKCFQNAEKDKEVLHDFIKQYCKSKRGNVTKLAIASDNHFNYINDLANDRKKISLQKLLEISEKIIEIEKNT